MNINEEGVIELFNDGGLSYSVVDMSEDNGYGSVSTLEKNVQLLRFTSEKITATYKNPDGSSIWVITFASENDGNTQYLYNTFYAFEINETGLNPIPVKSTPDNSNTPTPRGYLKIAPNGKKLVSANAGFNTNKYSSFIYDFDAETGIVSNKIRLLTNM